MTDRLENEIEVEGSVNGRSLTLDAIPMKSGLLPILLPRRRVASSLAAGFREPWISGDAADGPEDTRRIEFELCTGVGSRYMILTVTVDGERREEVVDVTELAKNWVTAVVTEGPTPKLDGAVS